MPPIFGLDARRRRLVSFVSVGIHPLIPGFAGGGRKFTGATRDGSEVVPKRRSFGSCRGGLTGLGLCVEGVPRLWAIVGFGVDAVLQSTIGRSINMFASM